MTYDRIPNCNSFQLGEGEKEGGKIKKTEREEKMAYRGGKVQTSRKGQSLKRNWREEEIIILSSKKRIS